MVNMTWSILMSGRKIVPYIKDSNDPIRCNPVTLTWLICTSMGFLENPCGSDWYHRSSTSIVVKKLRKWIHVEFKTYHLTWRPYWRRYYYSLMKKVEFNLLNIQFRILQHSDSDREDNSWRGDAEHHFELIDPIEQSI